MQTTTNGISEKVLGTCEKFEEIQLGNERYNMFTGCPAAKTVTIILRGGASQYIEEAERSINDALMIVIRAVRARAVVAGGGAIEMELSRYLKEKIFKVKGKHQLVMQGFARSLEIIPK